MDNLISMISALSAELRLLIYIGFAVGIHLVVILIKRFSTLTIRRRSDRRFRKTQSLITLGSSVLVFSLYFLAIGFILRELGVSLTAYLASASVLGLAIGFGSQGVVQDVVTGLTFIFSDLVDVGDLVEVSGQTGVVRAITMRFIELESSFGARVFVPNRTITNIVNYPRGYVRCLVDVTLLGNEEGRATGLAIVEKQMQAMYGQFPGIFILPPSIEGRFTVESGKEFVRTKFRIWPGRGGPIESTFVQELTARLRELDPTFAPWMIAVSYEAETRHAPASSALPWPWRKRAASLPPRSDARRR